MFRMIFQKRRVHLADVVEAFSDAKCKEFSLAGADTLRLSVFIDPSSDIRNRSVVGNKNPIESFGTVFNQLWGGVNFGLNDFFGLWEGVYR